MDRSKEIPSSQSVSSRPPTELNPRYGAPAGQNLNYGAPAGQNLNYGAPAGQNLNYGSQAGQNLNYGAPAGQNLNYGAPAGQNPNYGPPAGQNPNYGPPAGQSPGYRAPTEHNVRLGAPTEQNPGKEYTKSLTSSRSEMMSPQKDDVEEVSNMLHSQTISGNTLNCQDPELESVKQIGSGSGGGGDGGGGGSMSKRGSQQHNCSDIRGTKNVSNQLDVKLHHSENAWKPGNQKTDDKEKTDESKTTDLYRKVRSILNKLTPQKFQTLIKQVQGLVIDTEDRLKGVTDIIFEMAISEPAFTMVHANMCRYLLTLKVPSDSKQGETVSFRVMLLTRCQRELKKVYDAQVDLDRRKKAIKEADPANKKELKEELVIAATTARWRSIGNIRFIGELFKLKMLKENIMHDCVFKLLRSRNEENLECLCHLLSSIGKELDSDKHKRRMDQYFQQIKKIVAEKKVSSRCRFMLQDVVELRDSNWKPRRGDDNPKTIDQIHKDAKREAVEQNVLAAIHMASHA